MLAHGYGEHIGRYEHVAAALVERGAVVYGPDHLGHGESDGERCWSTDFEHVVDDLHAVVELARERHPGLPVVLVGALDGRPDRSALRAAPRRRAGRPGAVGAVDRRWARCCADLAAGARAAGRPDRRRPCSRATRRSARPTRPTRWSGTAAGSARRSRRSWRANEAIDAGPGFGALPVLYVHGEADELVPLALAQPAVERLAGDDFTEEIVPGARHETFNEFDKDATIGLVADFAERVTAASAPRFLTCACPARPSLRCGTCEPS